MAIDLGPPPASGVGITETETHYVFWVRPGFLEEMRQIDGRLSRLKIVKLEKAAAGPRDRWGGVK